MKIRAKFLGTFIPIFSLALIGLSIFSISIFSKDKIAYVFASTQDSAQMASLLVQTQMQAQAPLFEMLIGNFNFAQKKFPDQSKAFLQLNENIMYIQVDALMGDRVIPLDSLGTAPKELKADRAAANAASSKNGMSLFFFKGNSEIWGLSRQVKIAGYDPENYRVVVLFRKNPFKAIFERPKYYDLFVMSKAGEVFVAPRELNTPQAENEAKGFVTQVLSNKEIPQSMSVGSFLMTWTPIQNTTYGIVSVTQKNKVTEAIDQMKQTSWGVLALLTSIGLICVLLIVRSLTQGIESLTSDMKKFADGQLTVKSKIESKDELGLMSKVFNQMTAQIESLIGQTAAAARMETELETARNVQQQFLPRQDFKSAAVEICGYCESASECGGDWWGYDVYENYCRVIIADVTGHGVAPAMLTAALHAGVSALRGRNLNLVDYVKGLNQVICASGNGELVLSMFVAEIDDRSEEIRYVNASHCAGIVIHASGDEKLSFLGDIGGPHLGRNPEAEFRMSSGVFKKGDRFLMYTDGLVEFANSQGRMFGEKRLVKILDKADQNQSLASLRQNVLADFQSFRKDEELPDDVTLVMLEKPRDLQV